MTSRTTSNVAGPVVLLAIVLASCGGSGTWTFSTSVPGDRLLNSLSSTEVATLCAEAKRSTSGLTKDDCHLVGFSTASAGASSSSTATDAELQVSCAQAAMNCLTNVTTPYCPLPAPADCTATVAELTACANESAAHTHTIATEVPACSGITRTAIENNTSVVSALAEQPPSCQTFEAKCSSSGSGSGGGGTNSSDADVGN